MVKDILVHRTSVPFAGCRQSVSLGRSTSSAGVSSLVGARTGDSGCPEGAEEGNVVGMRPFKAYAPDARAIQKKASCAPADASFTRSSDTCASIVTTHRRRKPFGGGALEAVSRSGKPAQAGGTGIGVVTGGRSAARRAKPLPQGRGRFRVRTGRWSRPSSQRGTRARARARTSK